MAQVEEAKFSCKQCGKSYKWKPEFAGKKVKCKCGYVMTAPAAPAKPKEEHDEPDFDALYDLADDGKQQAASAMEAQIRCPSCQTGLEIGTTVCSNCGFNLKTGKKASAKASGGGGAALAGGAAVGALGAKAAPAGGAFAAFGAPKRGLQKETRGESKLLDLYIPIGLIAVGFILTVLISTTFSATVHDFPTSMMYAGFKGVLGLVLLAIGGIFCVKWGEIAFGEPTSAALKLAGFALGPPAVAGIISFLVHDAPPNGWGLVGFFIAFGLFFVLANYLFEWDMSEQWVVAGMATVICMLAVPFIFQFAISGGVTGMAARGTNNEDAEIDYMLELGRPVPARAWFDESQNRMIGDYTREISTKLIDDLYAAGPKKGEIWLVSDGPQAAEIYVRLPSDAKKRKTMFDSANAWNAANKRATVKDEGQDWLILTFMPYARPAPM